MNSILNRIVNPLLFWFDENARILPWRDQPTPYRVWVSEIMLQQTRVEAVKPYYQRFMEALPDIKTLAECEENRLLKLWEGLGYYNRVRNMQIAARTIMEKYEGEFPSDYEEILKLKGIGSYTAGAVASIAYGIPVPAVDGNVLRVISRITASEEDILKTSVKRKMEEQLKAVIPPGRAGAFNQALMELGAIICVPNGMAKCHECPLKEICLAKERNIVMELPKKAPKKKRRVEEMTVLILGDGEKAAIQKRPKKGLLAGLYELPNLKGHLSSEEVIDWLNNTGLSAVRIQPLGEAKHIFSHVEWHMIGYTVLLENVVEEKMGDMLFIEPRDTEEKYPIPAAFEAYAAHLQIRLGQDKFNKQE